MFLFSNNPGRMLVDIATLKNGSIVSIHFIDITYYVPVQPFGMDIWVPIPRCILPHRRQRNTPRFTDAHTVGSKPQSAHLRFIGIFRK